MDKNRPMYGPLLKVERANYHISEIEAIFGRYINANVKSMRGKFNRKTRKYTPSTFVPKLPDYTPTIIGDAVHNLRVSLDHAYWVLVESNGGQFTRKVKFPFFDTRKQVEKTLKGYPETVLPKENVIKFIVDDMQPFEGGRLSLYALHRLDITDKHQLLLPTYRQFNLGPHTLSASGRPLFTGEDGTKLLQTSPDAPLLVADGPIKYTGNLQGAISVLFGPGEMERSPVLETMRTLSKNITSAIEALEAFI